MEMDNNKKAEEIKKNHYKNNPTERETERLFFKFYEDLENKEYELEDENTR